MRGQEDFREGDWVLPELKKAPGAPPVFGRLAFFSVLGIFLATLIAGSMTSLPRALWIGAIIMLIVGGVFGTLSIRRKERSRFLTATIVFVVASPIVLFGVGFLVLAVYGWGLSQR